MFCKNCGSEIKENTSFCGNCGAKVELAGAQPIPPVQPTQSAAADAPSAPEATNMYSFDRNAYIGKAYIFDYYIGLNVRSFRISRSATGFNDDHLLYSKGLSRSQIPYGIIKEIKDETKTSAYAVFCIALLALVAVICIACDAIIYALIAAALAALAIKGKNCRTISISTADNKVFKIKTVPKNQEADEFLTYLRNETGIR